MDTEQIVRDYFESRGWVVTELHPRGGGKEEAADFRICHEGYCFLCEVKTVELVRANYPYSPLACLTEERARRQAENDEWQRANPDKRLIFPPGVWESIYGDEIEFQKKYRHLKRNTEDNFRKFFEKPVRDYFKKSSVMHFPYMVSIDSRDLYIPTPQERGSFCEWLENEIRAIHSGKPAWRDWDIQEQGPGLPTFYTTFYPIHVSKYENDPPSDVLVSIVGPGRNSNLTLDIHCNGALNLDAISNNVNKGIRQLRSSAAKEKDRTIARVIVLAFEAGFILFSHKESLFEHLAWLLEENPDLSAIAVLHWVPDGTPPPKEKGFHALSAFVRNTPWVHTFIVYHNSWLEAIKPLDASVFSDKWSIQFSPVKQ